MPLIPDGYANVTLTWSLSGASKIYSTVIAAGDGDLDSTAAQPLADTWYDGIVATGRPCNANQMYVGWVFDGVEVLLRETGTGTFFTASGGAAITGALSTGSPPIELVPGYTPLCITKRTAIAGRQGRGRLYPPATHLHVGQVDYNGVIDATALGIIQTSWADYLGVVNATSASQMVVTHVTPGPNNGEPVTSLLVRPVVASQRRRKARGA